MDGLSQNTVVLKSIHMPKFINSNSCYDSITPKKLFVFVAITSMICSLIFIGKKILNSFGCKNSEKTNSEASKVSDEGKDTSKPNLGKSEEPKKDKYEDTTGLL